MEAHESIEAKRVRAIQALMILSIGESRSLDDHGETWLTRVPNGWVFSTTIRDATTGALAHSSCFVPERLPADPQRPAEPAW
ncbi:MAG TPA: hypothetical protein ENN80_15470 [Candidatus Hydrogenedentes bacterium]|nr:hypothetical protein [Candidatus Hydrogenedentota bacterium]